MTAAVECAGCYRPIRDRFLLKVLDKDWHSSCVRCQMCRKLLDEKCFYKEGKMYCKDDFYRWENIFVLIFMNLTIKYEVSWAPKGKILWIIILTATYENCRHENHVFF